jgi:hypothetical protein
MESIILSMREIRSVQNMKKKRVLFLLLALILLMTSCKTSQRELPSAESASGPEPAETVETVENAEAQQSSQDKQPSSSVLPNSIQADENGKFPMISAEEYETLISKGEPDLEKPEKIEFPNVLEDQSVQKWLKENYPDITDWSIVCSKDDYYLAKDSFDPYRMQWREQFVPRYFTILSTNLSQDFDRLMITGIKEIVLNVEDGGYVPSEQLLLTAYEGFEEQLQLGDRSEFEVLYADSVYSYGLWFPEQNRAVLTSDQGIYEVSCSEPPEAIWMSEPIKGSDALLMFMGEHGKIRLFYYDTKTKALSALSKEEDGNPQVYPLKNGNSCVLCQGKLYLYDFLGEEPTSPVAVLDGSNLGTQEGEVWLMYTLAPLRESEDALAVMYYQKEERIWRICTFDCNGNIISDFSTGLEVKDDYIGSLNYSDGLVYFSYFADGTDQPSQKYCANAIKGSGHNIQKIQ